MRVDGLTKLSSLTPVLLDERVGVVKVAHEEHRQPEDSDIHRFVAQASNTRAFCAQENFAHGGGSSASRGIAAAKAIGEAVERYCAAQYDRAALPLTSAHDAPFPCVDPADFALYGPEQYAEPDYPFVPFTRDTPIRWVAARDAFTGEVAHVPASMVYVPYAADLEAGEQAIAQPISTGLALHSSPEDAAVSAIGEVIERDCFTLTWQARMTPPRIRLDSLDLDNRDLVERFHEAGGKIHLLDITLDTGVPTVLAVSLGLDPAAPALGVAASTALDPAEAVRKALEELSHTCRYMWGIQADRPRVEIEAITDQSSHLRYWCEADRTADAAFLWSSPVERRLEDLSDLSGGSAGADFETLVERVEATGHRVWLTDVTSEDVAGLGLTVLRALIPGFHPLTMGHTRRALGGRRLWSVAQRLGYPGVTPAGGDNPFPHPYP